MNAVKAKRVRVSIAKKWGYWISSEKGNQEWTLKSQLTFEDYVNIGSNVQTDEQLTETQIQIKLQSGPMGDLEEEVAEEENAI